MKKLNEPRKVTLPDAWGRDSTTMRQNFEVEPEDAGRTKPNFLGYRYRDYTFTRNDVGRSIEVITAIDYECWAFTS